jgi:hypothetical protein
MSNLRKFTLAYNDKKERWDLEDDRTNRVVKSFDIKHDATASGVLKKALGKEGGSVRIEKKAGGYEEERTFPRSADPRRSRG